MCHICWQTGRDPTTLSDRLDLQNCSFTWPFVFCCHWCFLYFDVLYSLGPHCLRSNMSSLYSLQMFWTDNFSLSLLASFYYYDCVKYVCKKCNCGHWELQWLNGQCLREGCVRKGSWSKTIAKSLVHVHPLWGPLKRGAAERTAWGPRRVSALNLGLYSNSKFIWLTKIKCWSLNP